MTTKRETDRLPAMRFLTFTGALTLSILLFSCSEKVTDQGDVKPKEIVKADRMDDVFINILEVPTFQGKEIVKFLEWVKERVKYPEVALTNGVQGKAIVGFCIEPDGSVSNVTVFRSLYPPFDEEVVRVV